MKFNEMYEIVKYFEEKQLCVTYPHKTNKPLRADYKSHAEYGEAMDTWELSVVEWRENHKKYNDEIRKINDAFKSAVLDYLELSNHPKADKFWELVWDRGHSGGYSDIVIEAETLAELLK